MGSSYVGIYNLLYSHVHKTTQFSDIEGIYKMYISIY